MKKITFEKIRKSRSVEILYDKGVLYFALSFLIPFIVMIAAFHNENIRVLWFDDGKLQETGNRQMLVVDLWHQYYPFFRVVREKLATGGSFLYSWQNGMGTNFLSLISYYAASPLNWLSVFFDNDHLREAMTYFLAAKIGFCGAFFSCFLGYTYKRRDLSIVPFSVMFALCSYMLGYYWNVMWFDTIALFPLVMLGVTALCREGKWKLYTITLALSLFSNYYIGYFTCLFTIFMFAAAIVIEGKGVKDFFYKLYLIVRSSIIGIGLGAFMLLPSYLALKLTYSANNVFPSSISWHEKWTDIFANLISYSEPTTKEGLPNLACGMLGIVLFGVFLFSAGIKIREKIAGTLMMAIIVVSCNMNKLDYIWHGFHVTNQLPYRFSFIFSFVLIAAAYRAYDVMTKKGIKLYQLILLVICPAAVFYMNYLSIKGKGEEFKVEAELKSSLMIAGAYFMIFTAIKFLPLKNERVRTAIINIAVAVTVVSELAQNAMIGVKTVGSSDRTGYPTVASEVSEMMGIIRENDDREFYRCEMTSTYTLNDSSLYGYNGISQFSSSANVAVTKYLKSIGLYANEAGNRFYYRTAPPTTNALLGIDYIISRNGIMRNSQFCLENIGSRGAVNLYKNKYPLSLGFMMESEILNAPETSFDNPFECQNDIMKKASGISEAVFTAQPVQLVDYNNVEATKTSYGSYNFRTEDADREASAVYDYGGVENGWLYGYVNSNSVASANVTCDGVSADQQVAVDGYSVVFPLGNGQSGSTSSVRLTMNEDSETGSYVIVAYALKQEAFEAAYNALADEQLNIREFSDTSITGDISVKKSGVLYLSIPYEKGWKIKVDGKDAEKVKVLNSMLGVELEAGEHEIELSYVPDGFYPGLIISFSALLLLCLFVYLDMRKKKKAEALPEQEANENNEPVMEDVPEIGIPEENEEENEKSESNDSVSGD